MVGFVTVTVCLQPFPYRPVKSDTSVFDSEIEAHLYAVHGATAATAMIEPEAKFRRVLSNEHIFSLFTIYISLKMIN